MTSIGDMIRRLVADREVRQPAAPVDGGLGGLTPEEDVELITLLNGGRRCECGDCACANPVRDPNRKPGA